MTQLPAEGLRVGSPELLGLVDSWLRGADTVAIDTEFKPLGQYTGDLWGVSLMMRGMPWKGIYLPIGDGYYTQEQLQALLNPHMATDKLWVIHNAKCDAIMLPRWGFNIRPECCRDTMLAYWLLDENAKQYGLKAMTWRMFKHKQMEYEEAAAFGRFSFEFFCYATADAYWTFQAWEKFVPKLESDGLMKLLTDLEMPVAFIVGEMEESGVGIDGQLLKAERAVSMKDYKSLTDSLYAAIPDDWDAIAERLDTAEREASMAKLAAEGKTPEEIAKIVEDKELPGVTSRSWRRDKRFPKGFNLGSGSHMAIFLYDIAHLPVLGMTKTGKRGVGAIVLKELGANLAEEVGVEDEEEGEEIELDEDVLSLDNLPPAEARALVENVLKWRKLRSLEDKFFAPYTEMIGEGFGRVHCRFNQTGTVTGRFSSAGPNLQQIPKKTRASFAAPPGFLFVNADYSQIELRLMAHYSEDKALLEAYNTPGGDVHKRTAKACGCDRDQAKGINFGFLYGMGAMKFVILHLKNTGQLMPVDQAQRFKDTFMGLYPGVPRYHARIEKVVLRDGYVRSMTGRRRRVGKVDRDKDKSAYYRALRQAINFTIQGSGADLLKIAIRNFKRYVLSRAKEDPRWTQVKFVLQVHDELMLETPQSIAVEVQTNLTRIMESAVKLKIPLVAEATLGRTWADCKSKDWKARLAGTPAPVPPAAPVQPPAAEVHP